LRLDDSFLPNDNLDGMVRKNCGDSKMKKAQLTGFLVAALAGITALVSMPAQAAKPFDRGERVVVESLTGVAGTGIGLLAGGLFGAVALPGNRGSFGNWGSIYMFGAIGGAIGSVTGVYVGGNAFEGSNGKFYGLVAGELIGIGAAIGSGFIIAANLKTEQTWLLITTISVLIIGGTVIGYELTQTQSQPAAMQQASPFTVAPQPTLGIQLPFVF
jgi:hypothetical protein